MANIQNLNQNSYCLYEPNKGLLRVSFTIDKYLVGGGDFQILDEKKNVVLDHWKFSVENGKTVAKEINVNLKSLHKANLIWNILVCSFNAQISDGKAAIQIFQDGSICKINPPAEKRLLNIPPCKVNYTVSFSGLIVLVMKS